MKLTKGATRRAILKGGGSAIALAGAATPASVRGQADCFGFASLKTFAALRLYDGDADAVLIAGRDTPGDGGAGLFVRLPDPVPDDDGIDLMDGVGRAWRRQFERSVSWR